MKGSADLLKTEDHNSNFLDFIKVLRDSTVTKKEVMIILEGHIRNMNFNDTWILVLENHPARSPTDSLQTVSSNLENLTKLTDEICLTVKNNTGQLANTMHMVADMKSQEVNEHKIRLQNLNQLPNFRELGFQERLTLVIDQVSNVINHRAFEIKSITPRPNTKFFKSLAIISLPTPQHKYNFEKKLTILRREKSDFKLSCSRPKLGHKKSDHFESEEDIKNQIKLHHDNLQKGTTNAHKDHEPLEENLVNGIQMILKHLKSPNRSYYEFMEPTNGTFFLVYKRAKNPFAHHDFSKSIPNPTVRKMAENNSDYLNKLNPKVWTKTNPPPKNNHTPQHPHTHPLRHTTPSLANRVIPWLIGGEFLSPS